MNQPPGYNNPPPGYPPQPPPPPQQPGYGYPPPGSGPMPASQSYYPPQPQYAPPQGRVRGFTRQIFNPAMYTQQGTSSWAAASLVLSLVGWLLCLGPITWPLSMIFGVIGLIGQKRSKGMAFAGFLISLIGVAVFGGAFGLGFHLQFFKQKFADEAGGPVVAAIEDFKKDHDGDVPASLDVLSDQGYLPRQWKVALDSLSGEVRKVVDGKDWDAFLRYTAEGSVTPIAQPQPPTQPHRRGLKGAKDRWDEKERWNERDEDPEMPWAPAVRSDALKGVKSYSLSFIGVDNVWGTSDDQSVGQSPEKKFDLSAFGGGEFFAKRRELIQSMHSMDDKIEDLTGNIPKEREKLQNAEVKLKERMRLQKLDTLDEVKKDLLAHSRLMQIGESKALIERYEARIKALKEQRELISIQVERLESQAAAASLGDSKEELAKLDVILGESKKLLGGDTSALGELDKKNEAEEWFKAQPEFK